MRRRTESFQITFRQSSLFLNSFHDHGQEIQGTIRSSMRSLQVKLELLSYLRISQPVNRRLKSYR